MEEKSEAKTKEVPPKSETNSIDFATGSEFFSWLLVGGSGALLLFLALTIGQLFNQGIRAGDYAERDILAPQTAFVIDSVATREAMENARELVVPVFQVDKSRDKDTLLKVDESLDRIKFLQSKGLVPEIGKTLKINLSTDEDYYLLTCSAKAFERIFKFDDFKDTNTLDGIISAKIKQTLTPGLNSKRKRVRLKAQESLKGLKKTFLELRSTFDQFVKVEDVISRSEVLVALSVLPERMSEYSSTITKTTNRICERFERFPVSNKDLWADTVFEFLPDQWEPTLRQSSSRIIANNLAPNLVIDPGATKKKVDQALADVKPVTREYKQGQKIVSKGTVISEEIAQTLQALGITRIGSFEFLAALGFTVIAAVAFAGFSIHTFEPKHFFSPSSLGLIYSVVIIASLSASLFGRSYPQFVPMAGAALCLTIFFSKRLALSVIVPLLILIAVDRLIGGTHLLAVSVASLAAILGYSKDRKSLMFTGLTIGLAQMLGFLIAFGICKALPFLSLGSSPWMVLAPHVSLPAMKDIGQLLAMEFAGGLASAIIAIGCLPFLESIFGLVTPYRLAEMAEADQPLLQQLEEKAPGTYQHSLAVANLAEAAAKAINVDVKLVRAGALYHDVGKLVRPKFFIENQLGAKNPHDLMSPEDSRDRVLAHVTDGLELAKKYNLPKAISDFIPMHQGTTLMAYFYHKASERDGAENVEESFYRYPGPKPNTKETAIVMLADAAEAVTHSMRDPTEEDVEKAIDKIFQLRWKDEQFSDAQMTYDELQRVKLAFVRVWRTVHHERLKYPSTDTGKMDAREEKKVSTVEDSKDSNAESGSDHKEESADLDSPDKEESGTESDAAWSARGEGCS